MNSPRKPTTVEECKIQASILLKSLRSADITKSTAAAKRLKRLPEFALSPEKSLQLPFKRKHALAVIAIENGFKSWQDLIAQMNLVIGGFLNIWFSNYAEAKTYLQAKGGFLFPYRICCTNPSNFCKNSWCFFGASFLNGTRGLCNKFYSRLYKKWMAIQDGFNKFDEKRG